MKSRILILLFVMGFHIMCRAQSYPWEHPLNIAWSFDGITFSPSSVFQDSSGVPSLVQWKGDTLICAFQWFRQPIGSPSWDRVAVKFSYDAGVTWTDPEPIVLNGMPSGFQRPFDPALNVFNGDSIRIYFSSSATMPVAGQDSIIDTYSAVSIDGIHYDFELNPRVNVSTARVIDPSVIYFNNSYHYLAPVGSPSQGAYHYVSPDGVNFIAVPVIPSDSSHNWTGNYMIESSNELRFYGSGPTLWYNSTPNGGMWNGYVNTNVHGGDPSVIKTPAGSYIMIYTGGQNSTAVTDLKGLSFSIYPNPAGDVIYVTGSEFPEDRSLYFIYDDLGRLMQTGKVGRNTIAIDISNLRGAVYFITVKCPSGDFNISFVKM